MTGGNDWLYQGEGTRPRLSWSLTLKAPLAGVQLARETGETLAADTAGGLYLVDRTGKLLSRTQSPGGIRTVTWSDTGSGGIALIDDAKLYWFNRGLRLQGWLEHSEPVVGLALDAHGEYLAVSLATGATILYDSGRNRLRRFTTSVPLVWLEFLVSRQAIVGVAEHGVLCCYSFRGEQEWNQGLWNAVGDLSVTGDGDTILLACFGHGIQRYEGTGRQVGSYQLDGTVSRVSTSFHPGHIAAATTERQFCLLRADGQVEYQATLPEEIHRIICDPIGKGVVVGLASGRVLRLDW